MVSYRVLGCCRWEADLHSLMFVESVWWSLCGCEYCFTMCKTDSRGWNGQWQTVECSDLHCSDASHIPPGWWIDNTTDELCSSSSICKGSVIAVAEELGFSKVLALFMPWMLTDAHKETRKAIVTVPNMTPEVRVYCLWSSRGVETWVHHFEPDSKQHLMEHSHTKYPLRINLWVCHQLENCG